MKKKVNYKNIAIIVICAIIILAILDVLYGYIKSKKFVIKNPIATMEVEGYGTVKLELDPEQAPNTVANFIALANRGFYNGLTFHRTIPTFMIQGGDKEGSGKGNVTLADLKEGGAEEKYSIKGEFIANGVKNKIKQERGVISMARADYSNMSTELLDEGYNSAGSQFFIVTKDSSAIDGLYAGFGRVIEGMDVVDKISNVEVYYRDSDLKEGEEAPKDAEGNAIASDTPKVAPVIKSISVETFGVEYGEPETMKTFDYNAWLSEKYGFQF